MSVSYGLPSGSKTAPTLYIGTGNGGSTTPSYGYVGKGTGASGTFLAPAQQSSPPSPPSPPPAAWGVQASLSGPNTVKVGQSITLSVSYNVITLNNGGTPPKYPVALSAGGGSSPYVHGDFSNSSVSTNSSSASASVTVYGDKVGSDTFTFIPVGKDANGVQQVGGNAGVTITVTN